MSTGAGDRMCDAGAESKVHPGPKQFRMEQKAHSGPAVFMEGTGLRARREGCLTSDAVDGEWPGAKHDGTSTLKLRLP